MGESDVRIFEGVDLVSGNVPHTEDPLSVADDGCAGLSEQEDTIGGGHVKLTPL